MALAQATARTHRPSSHSRAAPAHAGGTRSSAYTCKACSACASDSRSAHVCTCSKLKAARATRTDPSRGGSPARHRRRRLAATVAPDSTRESLTCANTNPREAIRLACAKREHRVATSTSEYWFVGLRMTHVAASTFPLQFQLSALIVAFCEKESLSLIGVGGSALYL